MQCRFVTTNIYPFILVLSCLSILLLGAIPCLAGGDNLYTLEQAIEMALSKNPDLQASHMDRQAARVLVKKAKGRLYPRLDAYTSYTRRGEPNAIAPMTGPSFANMPYFSRDLYAAGLRLSFPIYQGGMIEADIKAASVNAMSSTYDTIYRKQLLAAMVSDNFYHILYLNALLKAQIKTLEALERTRADSALRLKLGKIPPLDLMEMDTEIAAQQQAIVSTKQAIRRAKQNLAVYMGLEPSTEPGVLGKLQKPVCRALDANSVEKLIEKRPDIVKVKKQVEKAQIMVKRAKGQRLPRAEVFGDYNLTAGSGLNEDENFWSAGISLSFNIFDGGAISAGVAEANAKLMAAQKRLKAVRLRAKSEILSSVSSFKEAQARLMLAERVQKSAREAFRIEKLRYNKGAGTVRELLKAQAAWQNAIAQYVRALYDIHSAVTAWKLATGTILTSSNNEF